MSVCKDKKTKQFYISYQVAKPEGGYKTFKIPKRWPQEVGIKFVRSIEAAEIEADKKRRKIYEHNGGDISFKELIEAYTNELKYHLKTQTSYGKILIISKYIEPSFHMDRDVIKLLSVQSMEIFKNSVLEQDITSKRKNLILGVMRSILEYAADHEYISYELSRKLERIIRPISQSSDQKKEKEFWSTDEWNKFYSTFDPNDKWKYFFKTMYIAGLRLGEGIALLWKDLNVEKKTLSITKSCDNFGNVSTTKNTSSTATVTISQELVEELLELKELMCASDEDCIFFANKRVSRTTIRRVMAEHIEKANVRFITVHGLRHSCASRLIHNGVSVLIVSKHLRHSSTKETLDTYAHIFPNETEGLIDRIF